METQQGVGGEGGRERGGGGGGGLKRDSEREATDASTLRHLGIYFSHGLSHRRPKGGRRLSRLGIAYRHTVALADLRLKAVSLESSMLVTGGPKKKLCAGGMRMKDMC